MRAGWFGSNAGKLLLAGLFSLIVVGLLCVQWLNAERLRQARAAVGQGGRTSEPGIPEPKLAPAPKSLAEHATPTAPHVRTVEPGTPGPKSGPILEDLAEHTATIGQQARTAGPATPESKQAMDPENPARQTAAVDQQAAMAGPGSLGLTQGPSPDPAGHAAAGRQVTAAEPGMPGPKPNPSPKSPAGQMAAIGQPARTAEPAMSKPKAPVRENQTIGRKPGGSGKAARPTRRAPAAVDHAAAGKRSRTGRFGRVVEQVPAQMAAIGQPARAAKPAMLNPKPVPVREDQTIGRKPGGSGKAARPTRRAPAAVDHAAAGKRLRTGRFSRVVERMPALHERRPGDGPSGSLRRFRDETAGPSGRSYPLANGLGWVEERRL
jgi:hypothetical protein